MKDRAGVENICDYSTPPHSVGKGEFTAEVLSKLPLEVLIEESCP